MLALIPARGGSKGVPRKNIQDLGGIPLIAHSIKAAQAAHRINHVVVDTDDDEIAEISRAYGADVPYQRPAHLANDTASAVDVYCHAAAVLKTQTLCVLLPTCPFRSCEDINQAVDMYVQQAAKAVISVTDAPVPMSWYRMVDADGVLRLAVDAVAANANRQACTTHVVPNGSIFCLDSTFIQRTRTYYGDATYPYYMPVERSLDIDTPADLEMARALMAWRKYDT